MATGRIPNKIDEFGRYVITTDDYLQRAATPPTYSRIGLTAANKSDWNDLRLEWVDLQTEYDDSLLCTSDTRKRVRLFKITFKTFAQPLLNKIAACDGTTETDATVFNIKLMRKNKTTPGTPIRKSCLLGFTSLGGGEFQVRARSTKDDRRSAIPEGANSIQLAYSIGTVQPVDEKDNTSLAIFTRAMFVFRAGNGNLSKKLFVYGRWYNTKYPELAGQWSILYTVVIS